jgi:carbon monoxide dehydrogenase subunit G
MDYDSHHQHAEVTLGVLVLGRILAEAIKVPLGLGGLKMTISFEKLEERPLEFAKLHAKGKGVGALMDMTTSFSLSGEGNHTSMAWEADVRIAGPVGSMGQRVLQPIVNQQVTNVLAALEQQVGSAGG